MNTPESIPIQQVATQRPQHGLSRFDLRWTLLPVTAGLVIGFAKPLLELVRFTAGNELYSHIPLIPFVSLFLVWLRRKQLTSASRFALRSAALPFLLGSVVLAATRGNVRFGDAPPIEDYLAWHTLVFLFFFISACCLFLEPNTLRSIRFPLFFLFFMAPFPVFLRDWIEAFLQQGSAIAAHALFLLSGTPVLREDVLFQLPGFRLEVAPECSGIHSTLVLFITSLVAAHLFLRSPWKRGLVVLAILPLALLRNGLRVFSIGYLCVYVDPGMIHSQIHHRGGPLFFALSLIPLFALLFLLWRSEQRRPHPPLRTFPEHH